MRCHNDAIYCCNMTGYLSREITPRLERTPACVAAVLAYNGKEAVKLDGRLFAIPLAQLME